MISAFGVDHGISKSLVGGAFKPASALSRAERRSVGGYKLARGVSKPHQEFKAESAQRHAAFRGEPNIQSSKHGMGFTPGMHAKGVTYRLGSAKGGRSVVRVEGKNKSSIDRVMGHEMRHAAPNRSEYRVHHQIIKDPVKTMREEARADMESAMGHYRKQAKRVRQGKPISVYASGAATGKPEQIQRAYPNMSDKQATKGIKAYRKTQNQIASAKGIKVPKAERKPMSRRKQAAIGGGVGVAGITAMGGLEHYTGKKKRNG